MKKNLLLFFFALLAVSWSMAQQSRYEKRADAESFNVLADVSAGKTKSLDVKDLKSRITLDEGFQGEEFPPDGWRVINGGDDKTWFRSTGQFSITDGASASILYSTTAHDDYLITPALVPATGDSIRFKAKNRHASYAETFDVLLSTSGNNQGDFTVTVASSIKPSATVAQQYAYDLSAWVGQKIYIAFYSNTTNEWQLMIDDVKGVNLWIPSEPDLIVTNLNKDYRLIPIGQLDDNITVSTRVKNIAAPLASGTAKVKGMINRAGGENIYTDSAVLTTSLDPGNSVDVQIQPAFATSELTLGDYQIISKVDLANDLNPSDNADTFNLSLTQHIYARDAGIVATNGIGGNMPVTFGNFFRIRSQAIMSSAQLQWPSSVGFANLKYKLALYKINPADSAITSVVFETADLLRTSALAGQLAIINIRPVTLEPGDYVFCVKQLTNTTINVATDGKRYGKFLIADNAENPTNFKLGISTLGTPMLRMDLTPKRILSFNVTDGTNPVKGASISFKQGSDELAWVTTDSAGKAEVYAVSGQYTYSISANGYVSQENVSIEIFSDQTEDVILVVSPPDFKLSTDTIKFPDMDFTYTAEQTVSFTNKGGGVITIAPSDITLTGTNTDQFTLINISDTARLGYYQSASIAVKFNPTAQGSYSATLNINDNISKTIHTVHIEGIAADYTVNAFPYVQSFDSVKFPPNGWITKKISGTANDSGTWKLKVGTGEYPVCQPFGTAMAYYDSYLYKKNTVGILSTTGLLIPNDGITYGVAFKMYRFGQPSSIDSLAVYVNDKNNLDGALFLGKINRHIAGKPAVESEGWYDYNFTIPASYYGNKSYVIFKGTSGYGFRMHVDEVKIEQMYSVTASTMPVGGGSVVGVGNYIAGTVASLKAIPANGYTFVNWTSGDSVVSSLPTFNYTVAPVDTTFTANFIGTYNVTFKAIGGGTMGIPGVSINYQGFIESDSTKPISGNVSTAVGGVATVQLPNGTYTFTATKNNCYTVESNFVVADTAMTVDIAIVAYPNVTLLVKSNNNVALQDVKIALDGYNLLTTNQFGKARLYLAKGSYTGIATRIGYDTLSVNFSVLENNDTTINLTMLQAPPRFAYTTDWSSGAQFDEGLVGVLFPELVFEFTNIGSDTLIVNRSHFVLTGDTVFKFAENYTDSLIKLATSQKSSVIVRLDPPEAGEYSGQLLYPNGGDTIRVNLSGASYRAHTVPFAEDFESNSFDTNRWKVVNGNQKNKWFVGNAINDVESNKSAIVSDDNGVTNNYTINSMSIVHFYTDVEIPAADTVGDVKLYFRWKGWGEASGGIYDYLRVSIVEPNFVPQAGEIFYAGALASFYKQSDWQTASISIPSTHFAKNKRIVFTWRNDNSGGVNPPIAVDDILLAKLVDIDSVYATSDIEVPYGTELSNVGLPEMIRVKLSDEVNGADTMDIKVSWDAGTPVYSAQTLGEYQFSGTLSAIGLKNTKDLKASVKVTVTKATPIVTVWPVAKDTIVYGNSVAQAGLEITEAIANVPGAFLYADSTEIPEVVAGGTPVQIKFVPTDTTNYVEVIDTVMITVEKYPVAVTANNIIKAFGQEYNFTGLEFTVAPDMLFADVINSVTLASEGADAVAVVNDTTGYDIVPSAAVGVGLHNYEINYVNGKMFVSDKKLLSFPNIEIADKVYDRTLDARVIRFGTVQGIDPAYPNIEVDTTAAVALFAGMNVGTELVVNVNGLVIRGADSAHYAMGLVSGTADITARPLQVINAVAQDKVYDGTTNATISGAELDSVKTGDVVTLTNAATGTFAQASVGTDIAVATQMSIMGAGAPNYLLTGQPELSADITPKTLTIGGSFTASSKEYDGTTVATINPAGLTLVGVITGDTIVLENVVAEFEDSAPANNKIVKIVSADISGAKADCYTLSLEGAPTARARIYMKYTLTLVANPAEGGTVNSEVEGSYLAGANVTVKAIPVDTYRFINWTRDSVEVNANKEFVYTMPSENVTLTANFEFIQKYNVKFNVVDAANAILDGASIAINNTTLTTDSTGVATIELEDGAYAYNVFKAGYVAISDSVVVNGANVDVNLTMNDFIAPPYMINAEVVNNNDVLVTWNRGFSDDFENYESFIIENIGDYVMVDVDGKPTYGIQNVTFTNSQYNGSYIVFAPNETTPPLPSNWQAHSGNKYLACFAATTPPNNDWLITPEYTLTSGAEFSFWARSATAQYGLERFNVGISTGGTNPSDFTIISGSSYLQAPVTWTKYTYGESELAPYVGQTVRFAIQCVSPDRFAFMVDDLSLETSKTTEQKGFLGYSVYVNNDEVATGLTTTEYTVEDLPVGTYTIGVRSVYTSGASDTIFAAPVTILPISYAVNFTVLEGQTAIAGAVINVNDTDLTTSAEGTATINLQNGTYQYTVTKDGYNTVTGSIIVNNADVNETVNMTLTSYTVTFNATSNNTPLAGVKVTVNGSEVTTGANGAAEMTLPNGTYSYTAVKAGYNNVEGNFTVNNSAQTVNIIMTEVTNTYTVTFNATSNNTPLAGVKVTVNGNEVTTGTNGVAEMTLPNGTYSYTAVKAGYSNVEGNFTVNNAAQTVNISMTEVTNTYTVTFNATSNNTPLAGVKVTVNGSEVTTGANGAAEMTLPNGTYSYTAEKAGYNNVEGSFTVNNAAQTVNINMTTGVEGIVESNIRLYPNPASSEITLERSSSEETVVEIFNSVGALIRTFKVQGTTTTLDIDMLGAGSYYVRIKGEAKTTVLPFIKH